MSDIKEVNSFGDSVKLHSNLPKLQDIIGEDVLGVLWITEMPLLNRPNLFDSLDYFVDGLLTNYYQQKKGAEALSQKDEKNFFVSKNFGTLFFLGHAVAIPDSNNVIRRMHNRLEELMKLVVSLQSDKRSILIIDSSKYHRSNLDHLKGKYKDFSFKTYFPFKN